MPLCVKEMKMPGDQTPYSPFPHSSPCARGSSKRASNLSLTTDVLEDATRLEINLYRVCVSDLPDHVRREEGRRWREDHADFIAAYNRMIETDGLPLEEWRPF